MSEELKSNHCTSGLYYGTDNYFIEAVSGDNEKAKDFKSFRESSFQMFKEGHVQNILLKGGYETVIIKCDCLHEMRKDVELQNNYGNSLY